LRGSNGIICLLSNVPNKFEIKIRRAHILEDSYRQIQFPTHKVCQLGFVSSRLCLYSLYFVVLFLFIYYLYIYVFSEFRLCCSFTVFLNISPFICEFLFLTNTLKVGQKVNCLFKVICFFLSFFCYSPFIDRIATNNNHF
jgi:hypothetical protein